MISKLQFYLLLVYNMLAGEANEEGETTDGWEEEDVTEPEVRRFSLNTLLNRNLPLWPHCFPFYDVSHQRV